METFHLYHLAACWGNRNIGPPTVHSPLTTGPVQPSISQAPAATRPVYLPLVPLVSRDSVIRAAAAQMVFASRTSQDFITPKQVSELEKWTGLVCAYLPGLRNRHNNFNRVC